MRAWPLLVLAPLLVVAACAGAGRTTTPARVDVVASFEPLREIAAAVGGGRVSVENLTPTGAEPHDFELDPAQIEAIDTADVVVYAGRGFQPAVEDMARRRDDVTVDVLDRVPLDRANDPHFWLDPTLLAVAVDDVTDALSSASPADAPAFRANAAQYKAKLGVLDDDYRGGLDDCVRRDIVTAHDAFAYLAQRYGLTQVAVAGINPDAEPDADRVASVADDVKRRGDTTVFAEELLPPDVANTLAREAGATTAVLNPIEGLTSQQLKAGDDYFSIMRDNLAALRTALACR